MPTDVTRQEECARLVARAVERFGGLDVLVNNAGAGMIAAFAPGLIDHVARRAVDRGR